MDDEFPPNLPPYFNGDSEALTPNSTEEPGWWASADGGETVHFIVRCVMTSLYILIIAVGLLGNITLVKIFITNSAMRSVPNIFISSLAAGDLLLLVTCVPVDAFRFFSEEWVFGEAACKLIPVIQLTSVGVSVFTLTALSNTVCVCVCVCVCVVAVLAQITLVAPHRYPPPPQLRPKSVQLLIMVYFIVQINKELKTRGLYILTAYRTVVQQRAPFNMETRKRLAKIVLVFVGLFALCWFPNHVLYMYRSFHYHQMDLSVAHLVITLLARVLSFSSSCVNPFALYLLSESFRRHFNSQLRCGRGPNPERQASYLHSTSHIRLTSIKKTTPTATIMAPAANGNASKQEAAL
uniref:Neuromedin B receptor n=1 Tax=Oryzias sinensis TaxID=183150 RepID=A0A8C7VAI1_9TELE